MTTRTKKLLAVTALIALPLAAWAADGLRSRDCGTDEPCCEAPCCPGPCCVR